MTRTRKLESVRGSSPKVVRRSAAGPAHDPAPEPKPPPGGLHESFPGILIQRKASCACGGGCPRCQEDEQRKIQTKLSVSQPGDVHEREADAIAAHVMSSSAGVPRVTAVNAGTDRKAKNGPSTSTGIVPNGGRPLAGPVRSFLEPRLGAGLGDVRVHDGPDAAAAAERVSARAFTLGADIVFGAGEHSPETPGGMRLLAHEVGHVLQQRAGGHDPECRSGTVIQRQPTGGTKKKPPPVPGGNVLYIGMNNYKPEVARLKTRFAGTSVSLTTVTVTEEEGATKAGGKAYDLTDDKGIEAFANSLNLNGEQVDQVKQLLKSQDTANRDDLAHVISVYDQTQQDGADRMSRVVLSGHSYGTKVYNEHVKGAIYFDALVKLADLYPKAAGQTRHLLVLACMAGSEDLVQDTYRQAFPNLQTFMGYTSSCPTGSGAADKLANWADVTDVDPTKLKAPESGQSNWASSGGYQGDEPINTIDLMTGLRSDESKFNEYFAGTKVDPDNHSGFLFDYYRRARNASQHTTSITGADHDYVQLHADQSFRLRFWPSMVAGFWQKNSAAITKGYGTATVPKYETMSRKDALAAIAAFATTSTATGKDKDEAARLLKALKDLDPNELSDNWIGH